MDIQLLLTTRKLKYKKYNKELIIRTQEKKKKKESENIYIYYKIVSVHTPIR